MIPRTELSAWADRTGIAVRWPDELVGAPDFRTDLRIDFGRCFVRTPGVVITPGDEAEVAAALRELRARKIRYVLRGSGHSSGGQALIEGGAVIDLGRLTGVVADDASSGVVRVRAGTYWLDLVEHLLPDRRPVALTTNAFSSVGGTLAVGGFGDTSHIYGLQTASVNALTLITPDGERHELGPDDELFRYALAGRGQLGAITEVTMPTLRARYTLAVRRLEWKAIGHFVRDAVMMSALRIYDFARVRVFWREGNAVEGICGRFGDGALVPEPGFELLQPAEWTDLATADLLEHLRADGNSGWGYACPAVELVLPLPAGLDAWNRINEEIHRSGILPYMRHGAALALVPRQALPLVPVPDAAYNLMIALRPMVPLAEVEALVEPVRRIAARAIDVGGRLYLMSVEPDRERVRAQFGDAWTRWAALKQTVDPDGLCNPGLLVP